MARGKKGIDGVDRVIDMFPAGSAKMIERLLKRAMERDAKNAGRAVQQAMRSSSGGSRRGGKLMASLGRELGKALKHRGDVGGRASIRQRAPDTGGKPFHFAHSVVGKSDAPAPASGGPVTGNGKTGRAAAHMRYIEREMAVERLYAVGAETTRDTATIARDRDDGSFDREPARDAHETAAAPGQTYIENPVKLESGEHVLFSFGTIGERFEDRLRFWTELEQAEAHPSARVQHRLIVELPHEATPQARFDMVKAFTQRFADDGIPFYAALHAPGAKNDSRNFHAHIVYSERPAARMIDPETGHEAWDFTVVKKWTDSSRHARESRPYRQDKLRDYTGYGFIPKLRKEFATVVTQVLERDAVKDGDGRPVRYDARSYRDMGVDVIAVQSINRIVADKVKLGKQTSLDGDYTKRMLATEIRDAAGRWDKSVHDLVALDNAIQAAAMSGKPQTYNKALPRELRGPLLASIPRKVLAGAGKKILETHRAALHLDVMERASVASLERIVAATAPKTVEAASRSKDAARKAEAPDREAAAMLHAAALEELAETRASVAKARRTAKIRVGAAVNAWKDLVNAPPPETSPRMKAIIRDIIDNPAPSPSRQDSVERTSREPVRSQTVDASRPTERATGRPAQAEPAKTQPPTPAQTTRPNLATRPTQAPTLDATPAGTRQADASRSVANETPGASREALGAKQAPSGPSAKPGSTKPGASTQAPTPKEPPAAPKARGIKNPLSFMDDDPFRIPTIEDLTGPLHPRLRQADLAIRNVFKYVRDSSDDPAVRMRMIEEIERRLGTIARDNGRERKAEAARKAERDAAERTAVAAQRARDAARPRTDPAQLDLGLGDPMPAKAVVPKAKQTPPVKPTEPPIQGDRAQQAAPPTNDATPPTKVTEVVARDLVAKEDRTEAASQPNKPAPGATPEAPSTGAPTDPGEHATKPLREEHPDDARRRRKREEDEKAAKKRRAVLAKKNRSRGR